MRSTKHTITCDRCGYTVGVKAWNYKELRVLADRGWTQYSSRKASPYHQGTTANYTKVNDLCRDCTLEMQAFMASCDMPLISIPKLLEHVESEAEINTIRATVSSRLKKIKDHNG
jgi:hypothetical protein